MSGADALWVAVHAALDARRDPLDDPRVVAALTAAPERLAEVAALCAALHVVPAAARGPRRRLRPMLLAAAAALLLAVGFWPRPDPPAGAPVALAAAAAAPAPPRGAVLHARGSSTRSAPPAPVAGVLEHRQLLTIHHP